MRNVALITDSIDVPVGSFSVKQPLPTHALRMADPFLLLHHSGRQEFNAGERGIFVGEHPHRGFEPVTFMFRGSVLHRDSLGNVGEIGPGGVQWITSGSGIMHEEGSPEHFAETGGEVELIQLWVNLPKAKKMMPPAYQEIQPDEIPTVDFLDGMVVLNVVAGTINGITGPATTQSPLITATGTATAGATGELDITSYPTLAVYVLHGRLTINDIHDVDAGRMVVFDDQPGAVSIASPVDTQFILLAGEPLNEPVVQHGPFVMNTEEEIRQTFRDLAGGKFGSIAEAHS